MEPELSNTLLLYKKPPLSRLHSLQSPVRSRFFLGIIHVGMNLAKETMCPMPSWSVFVFILNPPFWVYELSILPPKLMNEEKGSF